jgi:hypothetical protein
MDTDLKAEILAQVARLDELIGKSTELIENANALLDQSRRLIRRAQPHGLGGGNHSLDMERLRRWSQHQQSFELTSGAAGPEARTKGGPA